jgi:hypothetical protein
MPRSLRIARHRGQEPLVERGRAPGRPRPPKGEARRTHPGRVSRGTQAGQEGRRPQGWSPGTGGGCPAPDAGSAASDPGPAPTHAGSAAPEPGSAASAGASSGPAGGGRPSRRGTRATVRTGGPAGSGRVGQRPGRSGSGLAARGSTGRPGSAGAVPARHLVERLEAAAAAPPRRGRAPSSGAERAGGTGRPCGFGGAVRPAAART